MRRALLAVAMLLLLATAGLLLGIGPLLNSEPVRARIIAAAERATGHPIQLGGRFEVAPGSLATLAPAISVEDVALLNPPGYSRAALLSARRVEAVLPLLPLLTGLVEVRSVTLDGADALLERDGSGRGNWLPAAPPPSVESPVSAPATRRPIEIGPVRIESGKIAGLGLPPVELRSITATPAGGPISGSIVISGMPLALIGDWTPPGTLALTATGGGLTLTISRQPDGSIDADLTADGAKLSAQGTLDPTGRHFEATVSAVIPDLARTGALAGLTLPRLQQAAMTSRIMSAPSGNGLLLRALRLTSAQGDLAGDLALTLLPRPALRGSLVSQQWNLDTWSIDRPTPAQTPTPASPPSPGPANETPWLIPNRPLPFALIQQADADLQLSVAQATYRGAAYRSVQARLLLQNGQLHLDPLRLVSSGGTLQGQFSADATATPPTASLTIHAPGLDMAGLAGAGALAGAIDLDLDLHGTGTTWHALAATLNGHITAALTDGDVENALLARLFGTALRGANIPVDPTGRSHVQCMVLRIDATDGQAHVGTLALNSTRLRLEGDGSLDLGNETMDMHLRPVLQLGRAAITVPVRLTGPFRTPHPAADKGVLSPGRFGISIAQLGGAPPPDPCGPALAAMHDAAPPK